VKKAEEETITDGGEKGEEGEKERVTGRKEKG
jgi:hypothetical protein